MKIIGDGAFRQEDLNSRSNDMTYSGALSFLRRKYSRDLTEVDVAVLGIPYDCATSNRPGARFGPRGIRAASTELSSLDAFPFNFDPFKYLAVVDYGDVWLDYGYPQNVVEKVEKQADAILGRSTSLLSFGGDHFISYPLLRSHHKLHGPISLIHFDAHSDTWEDDGNRLDHGSMFLRAAREGIVIPEKSVQIGIRTQNYCTHGFNILHAQWVHTNGVQDVIDTIHDIISPEDPVYITFDIDCLDPAFAPGTGTPVVGGLSTTQVLPILQSLGDLNLIGMDIVEVAPVYDHAEITSLAAATIGYNYICLMAQIKGATAKHIGTKLNETPSGSAAG